MPLPSALLLAATYPNPPVLQPTSPRTQGANTPIGLVGHRIPHRSATASSSFPPSLLPSLPPSFSYIWMHSSLPVKFSPFPFPSPSPSPSPSSLSPLSDTYVRMSLLSELPHATFVVFGEGCGSFNVWCVIVCTHLCHLCTGSTTPAHS